jgi:hypothetical protein
VKSQADSSATQFVNLCPGKWPAEVRLALVRRTVGFCSIETFDLFAGYEAGTKKEVQGNARFTRDGPRIQINVGKAVVEGDENRAWWKFSDANGSRAKIIKRKRSEPFGSQERHLFAKLPRRHRVAR